MEEILEKILAEIKKNPTGTQAYEDLYYMSKEAMKNDEALGIRYLKILSELIEKRIPLATSDKDLRFIFELHKRVLLTAAPYDFDSYMVQVDGLYKVQVGADRKTRLTKAGYDYNKVQAK